ncbi:hypothetical protein B0T17DRAFT_531120 [Bombardia bombarda]|uniref:Uncharacterized protein n=1 Tax=Bombardia bombarda TaxID=252184 RepID=A0AA39X0A5_9PEZI|nr:hypothetical protein B0T17DRAFT_531120 [Bombardia bombarda]
MGQPDPPRHLGPRRALHLPLRLLRATYYSGVLTGSPYHCIGTATAPNITGPYLAQDTPFGVTAHFCGRYLRRPILLVLVVFFTIVFLALGGRCETGCPPLLELRCC